MSVYYGAHKSNVFAMSQYEQYVCYTYALSVNHDMWMDMQHVKCEGLSVFYGSITFAFEFYYQLPTNSNISVYSLINSVWV